MYGCETLTLTLREEQRLRVFENKVLRKIFGAKRGEVTGEWRKLHNAELHALYSSPHIIRNIKSRRLRWAGRVARMDESRNVYGVLVGRPEGKRSLGRPRRRWEDNIKMDLREVGYDGRDWINLAQDRDRWRVAQLVEQLAKDWKVRGSIPGGDRIFSRCQTFRTAPRFTQPPIKLSTASFPGVKGGQSVVPTTPPHSSAEHCIGQKHGLYEKKRLEAFEMWIWRRMERVKWTDRIRTEAVLKRLGEERMMLKQSRKKKRNWLEFLPLLYVCNDDTPPHQVTLTARYLPSGCTPDLPSRCCTTEGES
ncbi:hypothetical protein ANN_06083 [Periplaneta americana]|uniref:Endonuclease-reverse transcriptase n=1 Tax=Periplaneta americana TaxID=6978 RepID=A0ABQ8TDU0_PERAM|nr:hypothetical protein ANN_06083 [Periplaneta americana]